MNKKSAASVNDKLLRIILDHLFNFQGHFFQLKTVYTQEDREGMIIVRNNGGYQVIFYIFNHKKLCRSDSVLSFSSPGLGPDEWESDGLIRALRQMGCDAGYFICKEELMKEISGRHYLPPGLNNLDTQMVVEAILIGMCAHEFRHELQARGVNKKFLAEGDLSRLFPPEDVPFVQEFFKASKEAYLRRDKGRVPKQEGEMKIRQEMDAVIIGRLAESSWARNRNMESIFSILKT